ncbi:MAG: nitrilase family protein [Saprospiraceae bacterium]|nr:nitrilase family protein [Saprospiraceae bacterium]
MKFTICQTGPVAGKLKENLAEVGSLIQRTELGGIYLFSEMFNTSYILSEEEMERDAAQQTLVFMKQMLSHTDAVAGGSIPILEDGHLYNRFLFMDKEGVLAAYDKVHLFTPAGEALHYSAGKDTTVLNHKGVRIMPLICYDLRFPYQSFNKGDLPYDILVYVANWPAPRITQWEKLLVARAIENQAYVVGVNRVGQDAYGNIYPGRSMVVDYSGQVICQMEDEPGIATIQIDMDALKSYRLKFPFLKDSTFR